MSAKPKPAFSMWSMTFAVYVPTILFSIGQGAVIPIIPLFGRELGASVAGAGLIVAVRGLGQLVGDMPAGVAVSRWGDKGVMLIGTLLVSVVAVGASFSPTPLILALLSFIMGIAWAFWQIARLAYVTEEAPIEVRGRALSMLGGMNRVGNFIGPVIGGFLGKELGLESAFIAQAVMGLAAAAMMFLVARQSSGSENFSGHGIGGRLLGTMVDNRRVLLTAGPPVIVLMVLRQARLVFLPLWGDEIGLDVAQIGLLTGISFLIDAAVFYPVGAVMDTWGRKWAAVPCLATMAIGLLVLPLTYDFTTFMAVAVITGVGNGFGAGINMTLGADFAPEVGRGEFLGVWRLVSDIGLVGGPVVISGLTAVGSLAVASVASGALGLAGAAMMALLVTETLKRPHIVKTSG